MTIESVTPSGSSTRDFSRYISRIRYVRDITAVLVVLTLLGSIIDDLLSIPLVLWDALTFIPAVLTVALLLCLLLSNFGDWHCSLIARYLLLASWVACFTCYGWLGQNAPFWSSTAVDSGLVNSGAVRDMLPALLIYIAIVGIVVTGFRHPSRSLISTGIAASSARALLLVSIGLAILECVFLGSGLSGPNGPVGHIWVVLTVFVALLASTIATVRGSRVGLAVAVGEALLAPIIFLFKYRL